MVYVDKKTGVVLDREPSLRCDKCGTQIDVSGIRPFAEAVCPSCHHGNPIPARLGHFLLYSLIGTGGMGGIYYGKDETLGRFVAVKVMLQSTGTDEAVLQSFKREAQAAAQLNHPNIVQIYSFGQEKGQPYIVMELVKGRKFISMIESSKGGLDIAFVMGVALNIAEGLQAAGDANLVHGDVKPENILLDERMQGKLVDFGLASISKQQAADGIWGTPYYIAPEKVLKQPADVRSDIYSLGATIFHALTGRPPFEGKTPQDVVKARLGRNAPPLSEVRPGINPEVERIVARMLEEEPAKRYPTYASLIGDLRKVVKDLAPHGVSQTLPSVRSKRLVVKKRTPRIRVESRTGGLDDSAEQTLERFRKMPLESRPKKRGKAALIVFAVFMLIVIVSAVVVSVMLVSRKREAERQERAAVLALRKEITGAEDILAGISKTATKVVALEDRVAGMPDKATNAVFVILGELIPAAPPPPPPPADTNAVGASSQTNAAPAADTNAPAADTNAPAASESAQPEAPPADDRPAIVLGRRVVNGADTVRRHAASARGTLERAKTLRDQAAAAKTAAAAATNVTALAAAADSLPALQAEAEAALKDAETAVRDLTSLERKTVAQREETARQQEIDLQRQREEQARQEKTAAELTRIEELQAQAMDLLKKFRCREAFELLEPEQASFTTPDGKASFDLLLERFKYLKGFKQFLTNSINANPFRWGWGTGPTAKDITAADENGIAITGGRESWDRMGAAHFIHLSKHYFSLPDAKSSVVGEQKLAVAIYLWLGAQTEEAVRYRDQAIETARFLEADARRLVPSF